MSATIVCIKKSEVRSQESGVRRINNGLKPHLIVSGTGVKTFFKTPLFRGGAFCLLTPVLLSLSCASIHRGIRVDTLAGLRKWVERRMKMLRVREVIIRHIMGVGVAIAWGFIYCAIASSLPMIQKLELDIQDSLIRLHKPGSPPEKILLVKINQFEMSGYDLHNLHNLNIFYATLVQSLIENGARVVVLNLPEQMKQYIDTDTDPRLKRPLKDTISQYSNQIVLVARPSTLPSGVSTLNIYNNLLPFNNKNTSPSITPDKIVSYFRQAPNRRALNNPARRVELFGRFSYEDDPDLNARHRVKSVARLALEKFYKVSNDQADLHRLTSLRILSPLQINFWGAADTFPSINFQFQCSSQIELEQCHSVFDSQSLQNLRDKLVLIDLPEGRMSESYSQPTPYGEMSIAEVQANLIASVMMHSFLATAKDAHSTITTLGFVLMSLYITNRFNKPKNQLIRLADLWFFLGLIGSYLALSLLLFLHGLLLPLSIPILGWLGTGSSVAAYLLFLQSVQQRQKLAERQAVLLQTRKLLHRVATDIHDGPLQELKLVMDKIELLNIQNPSPMIEQLLDHIEAIGLALRNQLSNTRNLAETLEITPELQFGLAQGIHEWLQQLINAGDLTIKVNQHLQPLREPKSDSAWIDAREDVFCFFREAITNIIHHAQPPNGTATEVTIYLLQEGNRCKLVIENNGTLPEHTDQDDLNKKRKTGGYGTKLMTTIASELPNGLCERVSLEKGGMRVTLEWTIEPV
ncbi:MAG: CHASE2 domain-containing protein [Aetokthonos hydrillicola CCALA 1050]|nr:CHASE2 domain-containing protein [Aetokthonos hydrillicola CCALA 1050]